MHIFFDHAFASVWCLLAAILSLYLCIFFFKLSEPVLQPKPVPL